MRKAIFFEEAYKQGILPTITEGYIFSINVPDMDDISNKLDPFLIKMISYSGLKTILPFEDGVKFQAQGKSMYCMLETQNYPQKHVEPASRSNNTTAFMPYRFSECDLFFTKDSKYRVIIPKQAHESFDSFTVNFPGKGDICILYYVYDKDLNKVVFPFMEENVSYILREDLGMRKIDADIIANKFMAVVKEFHL